MLRFPAPALPTLLLLSAVTHGPARAQEAGNAPQAPGATQAQLAGDDALRENRQLTVWLGHTQSNNIQHSEFGRESGSYESMGLLLGLEHISPRVDASIVSDLEYRTYSSTAIEDETVGALEAVAEIDLVKDRFSWQFADDYGQGSINPFAAARPGNRENLNVVSTGPRLELPLRGRTSFEASGNFSARRYDISSASDSDSTEYEVGLFRQTTRTAQLGIVANTDEIEYKQSASPPYQIDSLSLRYLKTLATGSVDAAIGTNEITFADERSSDPLFTFTWTRALATRSQLSVTAARQFTDSGAQLSSTSLDDPNANTLLVVAPNPVDQHSLGLDYVLNLTRTTAAASIGNSEYRYIGDAALDNDATELQFALQHAVSTRLEFGTTYTKVDRKFRTGSVADQHDSDSTLTAWVNKALGQHFAVALAISQYDRTGVESFDERRYEVRFGYSPTESGVAAVGAIGR